ncbi:hypothetical protein HYX18_03975 [Candidatus Woesearchaeota archaeon]|nr:hypothetical protein [Candidatus Woesearchaeota archaeon]
MEPENTKNNPETPIEEQKDLTSHEKKQLKKQQREEERKKSEEIRSKKESGKKALKYGIIAVVVLLIGLGIFAIAKSLKATKPIHSGPYHWHSNLKIYVCGEEQPLRCSSNLCGIVSLHHHNDDIIHIEGNVLRNEADISLGKFFDAINIPFSETQIMDKKNSDLCNGKPGKVNMYINGIPSNEFHNHILNQCNAQQPAEILQRCEKIEIKFE